MEPWRLRNLPTPSEIVAVIVFLATATIVYVWLPVRVIDAKADVAAESTARDRQVRELEQRIGKRLEPLVAELDARFSDQPGDLQSIQWPL